MWSFLSFFPQQNIFLISDVMFDMTLVAFWFYVIVLSGVSFSLLSGSGEAVR